MVMESSMMILVLWSPAKNQNQHHQIPITTTTQYKTTSPWYRTTPFDAIVLVIEIFCVVVLFIVLFACLFSKHSDDRLQFTNTPTSYANQAYNPNEHHEVPPPHHGEDRLPTYEEAIRCYQ